MILRELFYYDTVTDEMSDDARYDSTFDDSPARYSDTRKTRLTLKQINRVRKATDLHKDEKVKDLAFIQQMYGAPAEPAEGGF